MKNRGFLVIPLILVAVLGAGCSQNRLESVMGLNTTTTGEIFVPWGTDSEHRFMPDACISGDRANFRGVDLISPTLVVRVVADPLDGIAVAFIDTQTGKRHTVLRASSCPDLRGDVQRTSWRINGVADVSGYVEIKCPSPSGAEIIGRIEFENCH